MGLGFRVRVRVFFPYKLCNKLLAWLLFMVCLESCLIMYSCVRTFAGRVWVKNFFPSQVVNIKLSTIALK